MIINRYDPATVRTEGGQHPDHRTHTPELHPVGEKRALRLTGRSVPDARFSELSTVSNLELSGLYATNKAAPPVAILTGRTAPFSVCQSRTKPSGKQWPGKSRPH